MSCRVLPGDDPAAVAEAAATLRRGGLVAFPTETVYGLGANAFDAGAVARVFEAKARPSFDPLIVHLADASAVALVARTGDPRIRILSERFWPGPLTLVLPRRERVPEIVTAGLDTVGVRVPAHPVAHALLLAVDTPIAAPSANPFGYVSPTTAAHVAERLGEAVEIVLDGGPCRVGVESTILSLAAQPLILRPGGVPREELEAALQTTIELATPSRRPEAPGQMPTHYATHTPLRILPEAAGCAPGGRGRVALLAFGPHGGEGYAAVEVLAPDRSLATAAANLFAALRRLDALGVDLILAEPCPEAGVGHAIMDRLRRASAAETHSRPRQDDRIPGRG